MSIKFNISNDIAQSAIDKLNKNKIDAFLVEYVAECFNIILTLYNQEINNDKINQKVTKRKGRRKKSEQTETISSVSDEKQQNSDSI